MFYSFIAQVLHNLYQVYPYYFIFLMEFKNFFKFQLFIAKLVCFLTFRFMLLDASVPFFITKLESSSKVFIYFENLIGQILLVPAESLPCIFE